ncbi:MAG: hypothetical protein PW791_02350 [Neorhizobium sp.]|nr:hypothetical protein [Neorhizobium sp.]
MAQDPIQPVPAPIPPVPMPPVPPITEPEPDRLPDEAPLPNPDENNEPPLQVDSHGCAISRCHRVQ